MDVLYIGCEINWFFTY